MKSLYKMCAAHTSLPRSLHFELHDDLTGTAFCRGGFADVFKRNYLGREVAIKVLRPPISNDLQDMTNVGR